MQQRWQDWAGLVLGAWLFFSPWILGFATASVAAGNAFILGIGVFVFFAIALSKPMLWEEWVNLVLAAWVFLAPFILQFTSVTAAAWNHWILGILIGADAIWAMARHSGHHRHQAA
ncbi:MAG: SPW repeat protein [Gammaproteobacteria bacterium]|jgi:hypothetical protein